MNESAAVSSPNEPSHKPEELYFCRQHGVMNKSTDLKEKADQIAKKA